MKTEQRGIALGAVSKVVHLRSLPSDVTDSEVIHIGMNYGRVTNVLMLKVGISLETFICGLSKVFLIFQNKKIIFS